MQTSPSTQQNKKVKVVIPDGQRNIGLTGTIRSEDEDFLVLEGDFGRTYKINKKSIIFISTLEQVTR